MAGLIDIVRNEVAKYAASSFNSKNYAALDDQNHVYVAMSVLNESGIDRATPIVMARVADDVVIIETDATNKPLVDALTQAGIPRDKIVLAYEGEKLQQQDAVGK